MHQLYQSLAAFGLAATLAAPLAAQATTTFVLQGGGGGLSPVTDLDRGHIYRTKTGMNLSAGAGIGVGERLAFRLDAAYSKSPVQFQGADAGFDFTRLFTSVVAQFQFPQDSGLMPFVLVGGGLSFINQNSTADPKKTTGHGMIGAGIGYRMSSGLTIFAEGRGYGYQPNGIMQNGSENRFLADLTFGAGLSYAFGM
jgi:hypothetical protein